jgi:hypothetical protein
MSFKFFKQSTYSFINLKLLKIQQPENYIITTTKCELTFGGHFTVKKSGHSTRNLQGLFSN